jgi:hypothetical protein
VRWGCRHVVSGHKDVIIDIVRELAARKGG